MALRFPVSDFYWAQCGLQDVTMQMGSRAWLLFSMHCQRSLKLLELCKMSTLPTQTATCRFYNTTQKTGVLTATVGFVTPR